MKILFNVAVGNTERNNFKSICNFFSMMCSSFEELGHECLIICHENSKTKNIYKNNIILKNIPEKFDFNPDFVFTWNGMLDGDCKLVNKFGKEKIIFGELGFFDHYDTCYFDFNGVGFNSSLMIDDVNDVCLDSCFIEDMKKKYIKKRLFNEDFIFVPLQDENDTQIKLGSPYKTMYDFLSYINTLYFDKKINILIKKHPKSKNKISNKFNFIEVKENVHHYIPYAKKVIGINSNVLFETMIYHNRILNVGLGICSRKFESNTERNKFLKECYSRQINLKNLNNVDIVKKSWIYKNMIEKYNERN